MALEDSAELDQEAELSTQTRILLVGRHRYD
jgi:hypothetical protein